MAAELKITPLLITEAFLWNSLPIDLWDFYRQIFKLRTLFCLSVATKPEHSPGTCRQQSVLHLLCSQYQASSADFCQQVTRWYHMLSNVWHIGAWAFTTLFKKQKNFGESVPRTQRNSLTPFQRVGDLYSFPSRYTASFMKHNRGSTGWSSWVPSKLGCSVRPCLSKRTILVSWVHLGASIWKAIRCWTSDSIFRIYLPRALRGILKIGEKYWKIRFSSPVLCYAWNCSGVINWRMVCCL